ncbi:MAG: apolipoprotein N-acyltransferase [Rhodospirillales bacterium]
MERLILFNRWVSIQAGWRRWGFAALLGVLATLAMPPVNAVYMLVPAFVGLIWLLDSSNSLRAAFAAGWWFGYGHFVAGLYWIGIALWIKASQFGWLIPFAVFGLPAIVACYMGIVALAFKVCQRRGYAVGAGRIIMFAVLWVFFEWVRGWAFTGFSWNLMGTVWSFSDSMIQFAALTGIYGLSFVTILAAAMPAIITDRFTQAGSQRSPVPIVIGAFAILLVIAAGGIFRLSQAEHNTVVGVHLRLVQPSIPQRLKWQRDLRAGHVMRQLYLIRLAPKQGKAMPTHVIWSETAVPFNLANEPQVKRVVAEGVPKNGLLITGAPRLKRWGPRSHQAWNSLHAINGAGNVVATFDKTHLVPFGEYVPFRWLLNMSKITTGTTDFTPGAGLKTLSLKGLPPVSPLICYEGIFPGQVVASGPRPQWLLNITNDAWYGRSAGPFQHFAAVRFRAVEEGMPLVRVANNGISAVVDSYGRVIARLGLNKSDIIDSPLPQSLKTLTPYARFGDRLVICLLVLLAVVGILLSRRTA